MTDPTTTKALLVGIEKYDAGDHWNLNGPAHDVLRMAKWLLRQGILADNLTIFLSPLDSKSNLEIADQIQNLTGSTPISATKPNIQNELTRLQRESASLFFFYWGGHGWVTQEGERRLFYADAQTKDERNLDFNNLLVTMRSDYYKEMSQQLFIIDACANYVYHSKNKPSSEILSKGSAIPSIEQFALFAAKLGDRAKNLDSEKTGLYTKELLTEFESLPPNVSWLPEIEAISARLQGKFVDLRKQGLAEQTPTTLWNRDWIGNDRSFGQMPITPAIGTISLPIEVPRRLETSELVQILDGLMRCDTLRDRQKRDVIVDQLRPQIRDNIDWANDIKTDIINIVNTSRNYPGGLKELLEIINLYESNSLQFEALKQTITQILPEEIQ
jgi:hypothetical protein